jgi:signal transduction histidine kinase/DNA-binding response OmpR family regulator
MILAVALVSAAGYLTYNSLSSIVASIQVKSRPDLRLLTIRDIAADLDKAESSVRMYRITREQQDIKPYYEVIGAIDEKIDSLQSASKGDTSLLCRIDTISGLIEENMIVWNKMLDLYHTDSLDIFIRTLTAKIAVGSLNKKNREGNILKRVFSRKAIKDQAQQVIISDLNKIGRQDSIRNFRMMETEAKLAVTSDAIRERLYILISRMENEVINTINNNSRTAERLARETYRWLALVALAGSLLVILVLIVVSRYVRKTRQYQRALEKSKEETEALARTKELFVANMSHEIRTPVNAIHGFAEQMAHQPHTEESRKMLRIIKSTSDHLVQIVNDILDFSKLQNTHIELEKTHFLIAPLCEELKLLFLQKTIARYTQLNYQINDSVPNVLYGDMHRLKQILFNLVGNAVKFTTHGEILYAVDVTEYRDGNFNLVITVKDTGIGIRKEMQTKVFEDFTQAEAGTSRKYGGTGLGLSIVKKLVELHHGQISLESAEGLGTRINCTLPYHKGDFNKVPKDMEEISVPGFIRNLHMLVVDDEEYNRMLFKTIFTRWKVRFNEADDGQKAIDLIKSGNYNMVFMDARMPGLDGIDASEYIRKTLGITGDSLPIIGTSATHTNEEMKLYSSAGMNAFLPKPFTEKMLLETILSVASDQSPFFKAMDGTEQSSRAIPVEDDQQQKGINLTNVYHLANNDITFVKQLINSFIESTEQGLGNLHDAISTNDSNGAREIAHRISSPCRHLGADGLYSRLKLIEDKARDNENIGILAKLSDESTTEFRSIKFALQKHLERI